MRTVPGGTVASDEDSSGGIGEAKEVSGGVGEAVSDGVSVGGWGGTGANVGWVFGGRMTSTGGWAGTVVSMRWETEAVGVWLGPAGDPVAEAVAAGLDSVAVGEDDGAQLGVGSGSAGGGDGLVGGVSLSVSAGDPSGPFGSSVD